jgi:hypothetical protein
MQLFRRLLFPLEYPSQELIMLEIGDRPCWSRPSFHLFWAEPTSFLLSERISPYELDWKHRGFCRAPCLFPLLFDSALTPAFKSDGKGRAYSSVAVEEPV